MKTKKFTIRPHWYDCLIQVAFHATIPFIIGAIFSMFLSIESLPQLATVLAPLLLIIWYWNKFTLNIKLNEHDIQVDYESPLWSGV